MEPDSHCSAGMAGLVVEMVVVVAGTAAGSAGTAGLVVVRNEPAVPTMGLTT